MSTSFQGKVCARIVETRFALSGKIAQVLKHSGDSVAKGNLIASLDRKILQMELDQELAGFENVRADFEIFAQKYPDPQDPVEKYLKTEKQAQLNVSVKNVELVKARLDQADLFSPATGIILDDSAIVPGLYVTPASAAISIIDTTSFYFEIEIKQEDLAFFAGPKEAEITISGLTQKITGTTGPVLADGKKFFVKIPLAENLSLLLGLNGEAICKE